MNINIIINKISNLTPLKLAAAILIASLALAGAVYAATNVYASLHAESGTRSGNVISLSDTSASNGQAIKFGQEVSLDNCPIPDLLTISSATQDDYPLYPIGTKVYVPDGPNPWRDGSDSLGGCFPGETNTGVAPDAVLTDYVSTIPARNQDPGHLTENFFWPDEGTCYIKAPGTVLENLDINCNLRIRSKNVQIINSRVTGFIFVDFDWCEHTGNGTSSFSLTDSTVFNPDPYSSYTLGRCDYTVTRSKVYGGPSIAACSNCSIIDSYLYLDDLSADEINGINHNSVIRVGPNAHLEHNTIQCHVKSYDNTGTTSDPTPASGCSANQTAYSHDGLAPYNSTIKRNFYMSTSGGYCAWGGSTSGEFNLDDGVRDIRFIENIFQRKSLHTLNATTGETGRTGTKCGYFGVVANFYDRPGHVWQCNRWDDGTELPSPVLAPVYTTNISC